uniref:Autophagy-related protein 2 n=1 Tax=Echinostoma caproni TaxID=27848 RepID=A0A183A8E0_9TREM
LSWPSISYPVNQTLGGLNSDSTIRTSSGPMFTLAVEHCQSQRPHPLSGVPVYRDDITLTVRLQDTCMAHWPQLEPVSDSGASSAGLPNWLTRLLLMLETPPNTVVSMLWPGYQLTDAVLIEHVHLERLLFTWSSPDLDPGSLNPSSYVIPSLRSVRALVGCESISLTINTASEAPINFSSEGTGGVSASIGQSTPTPSPGMLIMSFVSNAAVFIYPILRTVPPGLEHLQSIANANATTNTPGGFLKWVTSFKITDCVCVADLDHMELRCFSDPMRNPLGDPNNPFLTRIDVRSTNNLLRLHTCADSLAALQILIQSLTPPDPGSLPSSKTKTRPDDVRPSERSLAVRSDSPANLMSKTPSQFGSRSSLHSNSPHHLNPRPSLENHITSGSASSVEDLLQGAISDVDSPRVSPYKLDDTASKRKPREHPVNIPLSRPGLHRSPEPRPCRTQQSTKPVPSGLYPRLDSEEFLQTDRTPSPVPQPSPSSSNSSPTEFVVIKPSMIPPRSVNPLGAKEQIRCLIPRSPESPSIAGSSLGPRASCGFEVREDHYPMPTVLSAAVGARNRMNRLFTDPPLVYPRATPFTGAVGDQFRSSPQLSQTPTPEHKHPRSSSGGSSGSLTSGPPSDGRPHSVKGGKEVGSGAAKIAGLQPGVRFRHDRPVSSMLTHTSSSSGTSNTSNNPMTATGMGYVGQIPVRTADFVSTISPQELYMRGGRNRDTVKGGKEVGSGAAKIAGLQPGVRFRHDRPVSSMLTHTSSSSGTSNTSNNPMTATGMGYVGQIPVRTADFVSTISPQELYMRGGRNRDNSKNTLMFIEEFQQLFSSFSTVPPEVNESSSNSSTMHLASASSTHDRTPCPSYSATPSDSSKPAEAGHSTSVISQQIPFTVPDGPEDIHFIDGRQATAERPTVFIRCAFTKHLLGFQLILTCAFLSPPTRCTSSWIVMGLWDLVYQPVQSVYQGKWDTGRSRDTQGGQWPATEWDLSICDLSTGAGNVVSGSSGGAGGFIQGLRRGTRSFSTSTLWATLQLSIQSVRTVQSIAEEWHSILSSYSSVALQTAYDLVTPGPALRSRQLRLRQPADLREGLGNAMNAMTRGFQMVTEDLCGATRLQSEVDLGYKGPVGMVGDVLRQIPPTIVAPVVTGCEVSEITFFFLPVPTSHRFSHLMLIHSRSDNRIVYMSSY